MKRVTSSPLTAPFFLPSPGSHFFFFFSFNILAFEIIPFWQADMIELPFFWGEFWSWPRSQKGLETTELRSIPHPRSLSMSPIAVFLSSSELGTASHPRPVLSGTSFPSHNFTQPALRHIHAQLCHAAQLHATRETWGQNHDGGGKPPTQLNLDLISPNKGVEDRAKESTLGRKNVTTAGFQRHLSEQLRGFLDV